MRKKYSDEKLLATYRELGIKVPEGQRGESPEAVGIRINRVSYDPIKMNIVFNGVQDFRTSRKK